MPEPYAKIIADSTTRDGHRLVTFEAGCWRPVLAEQNTHRVFSRNSASSRAIPITKNLARFNDERMYPAEWRAEQKGMQGGSELTGDDLVDAQGVWDGIADTIAERIQEYVDRYPDKSRRLHKSLLNRWLEPGLQQVQIISGTNFDGYFWQRCGEAADPNIRLMAEAMREAMEASTPKFLREGEWHLPYFGPENGGHPDDWSDASKWVGLGESIYPVAKKVSAGRCARVSYLNQAGQRDLRDDLVLYERLADRSETPEDPPHASPLEHVATPWPSNEQYVDLPTGETMGPLPRLGNFLGWFQMRHEELAF